MAASAPGRRVAGRYLLKSLLGSGGMGVVWLAEDSLLGREVAIKEVTLPPTVPESERASLHARVLREARAAARLTHPGAVTLYTVEQERSHAYIVMELVRARTLGALVREQGPLPPDRVAGIGEQVASALQAAHRAGIVHRDVKPANVMVAADGTAKLADFGIATIQGDPQLTSTGLVVGSAQYMSPEQARGEAVGPASDWWSLGATMYYAAEGQPPFDRGGAVATAAAIASEPPRPARRAGALAPVLATLLVRRPEQRLTGDELRRRLRRVAAAAQEATGAHPAVTADEPDTLVAPPPAPSAHGGAPLSGRLRPRRGTGRRYPVAAIPLAAVAVAVIVAVAATLSLREPGDGGPAPAPPPSRAAEAPDGWRALGNPGGGYRIATPPGWSVDSGNARNGTTVRDRATGRTFIVESTSSPADPLTAWRDLERGFARDHRDDGYQRLAFRQGTYAGLPAVVWEFRYRFGGQTVRVRDVTFRSRDQRHGYAVLFRTPEHLWDRSQPVASSFEQAFQVID